MRPPQLGSRSPSGQGGSIRIEEVRVKSKALFGALVGTVAVAAGLVAVSVAGGKATPAALPAPHPTLSDYQFISGSTTPPTDAQCESVGRTCFTPQAIQSAYDVGPLYAGGFDGRGKTIARSEEHTSELQSLRHLVCPRRL